MYCGCDAAEAIVAAGAKGAGIDAVSFGGYGDPAKAGPSHRAMLGSGKFVVEELYFPDEVMDGKRRLFCVRSGETAGLQRRVDTRRAVGVYVRV